MKSKLHVERLEPRQLLAAWQNPDISLDVNGSGSVTALDALVVINDLNAHGQRALGGMPTSSDHFLDVNGNGRVSAIDALIVINALNEPRTPLNLVLSLDPEDDPNGNSVVLDDRVKFRGQTAAGARIDLTVQALDATLSAVDGMHTATVIRVDQQGVFTVEQSLYWGLNQISAVTTDRLGKSLRVEFEVMRGDVVADWNAAALNVVRDWTTTSNDPYPGRIVPSRPPEVALRLALIHTAMFDAMNSVDGDYASYLPDLPPNSPETSQEAAGVSAAYSVARALYPNNRELAVWDATRSETLKHIAEGPAKDAGIVYGQNVATRLLALRSSDGSTGSASYTPSGELGDWARTAPDYIPPLLPHWGQVHPVAVESAEQYRPDPPPDLSSEAYAQAVDEVLRLGRVDSSERTADQTEIALFWADGGGTATPPGHWNRIASRISLQQEHSVLEHARTLALLNLAMADAGIASWDAKYTYDLWRPIDAIRRADQDGNNATSVDSQWLPLLRTPPFPAYTSGHSSFSGAAAAVLTTLFGEEYAFASRSDGHTGLTQKPLQSVMTRQFARFADAANEASKSRVYGGIHYSFDGSAGLAAGKAIGEYVTENWLLELNE